LDDICEKLAAELLRVKPDMPIILCTGYSDLISAEKAPELGIREFLMKPVVLGEIGRIIRRILDSNV
jgi:DNA-binding NtrC family response regulator